MGVAETHEARAFGIFHHAALERDGTQFVGLSAAGPHVLILRVSGPLRFRIAQPARNRR
jgi:hypothetical protein